MFCKIILSLSFIAISSFFFAQDIFSAAREGNLNQISALAKLNKDTVYSINEAGFNPLMIATYRGQNDAAILLVKLGSTINANSPEGTVLQAACYQNNESLARFFVENGANINASSPDGTTALMFVVMAQNEQLVQFLVENGADLTVKNNDGQTAFSLAKALQNKKIQTIVKFSEK